MICKLGISLRWMGRKEGLAKEMELKGCNLKVKEEWSGKMG